ncbi:MAG: hypothetical protein NTX73_09985 [Rhodobacterales bacterium]|nr:hypothetical protein [Rhodobacterales bacterium]
MVSDYPRSLAFWTGPLGFTAAFTGPGQKFACQTRPEGAQVMIYERDGDWETVLLDPPFRRGRIIKIYVADVDVVRQAQTALNWPLCVDLHEKWRDLRSRLGSQREFLVQDADGYLLMVVQGSAKGPCRRQTDGLRGVTCGTQPSCRVYRIRRP